MADMTVGAQRIADEINNEHRLAQSHYAEHAIRCGELLLEQKSRAGHGNFLAWFGANCSQYFAYSTAARYMAAAKQISTGGEISSLRSLFPSGRRPSKPPIGEKSSSVRDSRIAKTSDEPRAIEGNSTPMMIAPTASPRVSREAAVEQAVATLKGNPQHRELLTKLIAARNDLVRAEAAVIRAARELR
ncbi:MAG TPA: hypothetical protein VJ738_01850 [Steroidobacteraceae bacterium]|nr:hypothetical protein [Steroidobacteraceae bacterium]